jgi:hypothetical protein
MPACELRSSGGAGLSGNWAARCGGTGEGLSQNAAYVGLSDLSHSDQILRQCGTKAAEPNPTIANGRGINVI